MPAAPAMAVCHGKPARRAIVLPQSERAGMLSFIESIDSR